MPADSIQRLIDGRYPDPDGDGFVGIPVRCIAIENSLAGDEADLVRQTGLTGRLAVVSDPRTHEALGERIVRSLSGPGQIVSVVLGDNPHADEDTVDFLEARTSMCDALIAVGSGTINDLCKYAAARTGKPYAVFATAPSMNGYTSSNAAITIGGHKKSLPASSAAGVFVDLTVLAAAPVRMIRAGLGDSSCRSTAQIDWLLSHHLFGTPYRIAPFAFLADDEPGLLDESAALVSGDLAAMRRLARTLILSGLGMTICGGSYPASQGEHLISHYIDMMAPGDRREIFHGEQIAVTTLTMARLQESFLRSDEPPRLVATRVTREDVLDHFGPEVGDACWHEFEQKVLTLDDVDNVNERLAASWSSVVEDCERVAVDSRRLQEVLTAVGAPTSPHSIALDTAFYNAAVEHARELRNRYTFLDLAGDTHGLHHRGDVP